MRVSYTFPDNPDDSIEWVIAENERHIVIHIRYPFGVDGAFDDALALLRAWVATMRRAPQDASTDG